MIQRRGKIEVHGGRNIIGVRIYMETINAVINYTSIKGQRKLIDVRKTREPLFN